MCNFARGLLFILQQKSGCSVYLDSQAEYYPLLLAAATTTNSSKQSRDEEIIKYLSRLVSSQITDINHSTVISLLHSSQQKKHHQSFFYELSFKKQTPYLTRLSAIEFYAQAYHSI